MCWANQQRNNTPCLNKVESKKPVTHSSKVSPERRDESPIEHSSILCGYPILMPRSTVPTLWALFVYQPLPEEYNMEANRKGIVCPVPPQPGDPGQHQQYQLKEMLLILPEVCQEWFQRCGLLPPTPNSNLRMRKIPANANSYKESYTLPNCQYHQKQKASGDSQEEPVEMEHPSVIWYPG